MQWCFAHFADFIDFIGSPGWAPSVAMSRTAVIIILGLQIRLTGRELPALIQLFHARIVSPEKLWALSQHRGSNLDFLPAGACLLVGCRAGGTGACQAGNFTGTGAARHAKADGPKTQRGRRETTKPPRKRPPRVGDEDQDASQSSATKPGTLPSSDLEREAKQAKHPAVQELFRRLAKPHDEVTLTNQRTWSVEPIPQYLGSKANFPPSLSLHRIDTDWKQIDFFTVSGKEIAKVEPYEQLALNKVDKFLGSGLDRIRRASNISRPGDVARGGEGAAGRPAFPRFGR